MIKCNRFVSNGEYTADNALEVLEIKINKWLETADFKIISMSHSMVTEIQEGETKYFTASALILSQP